MPDIFDEVEEDLRADRARKLLRRYGGLLIAAAVLVVIAVAGWEAWQAIRLRRAETVASDYMQAARLAGQPAGRADALSRLDAIGAHGPGGYAAVARLRAAGIRQAAGDLPGAIALWDAVAADASVDRLLRDLATLRSATNQIDDAAPESVAARLQPLAAPDNPFRPLAREALALLALRRNSPDEARPILRDLVQDGALPQDLRARAAALLTQLGL